MKNKLPVKKNTFFDNFVKEQMKSPFFAKEYKKAGIEIKSNQVKNKLAFLNLSFETLLLLNLQLENSKNIWFLEQILGEALHKIYNHPDFKNLSDLPFWKNMNEAAKTSQSSPDWEKAGINLNEKNFETFKKDEIHQEFQFCIMSCDKPVKWIRHTQFAGSHPFCNVCAKKEKDFKDKTLWEKVK